MALLKANAVPVLTKTCERAAGEQFLHHRAAHSAITLQLHLLRLYQLGPAFKPTTHEMEGVAEGGQGLQRHTTRRHVVTGK
ncbi:hypothetical protein TWF481_010947 [Arthrobotrys musiformis]|uniref:Uncharacterized protein n=1 Tax=Arthrobotrys musiformis TaxID=47236 RepID=A0AAV9VWW3_9PEZI